LQPGEGLQLGFLLKVCQAGQMGRYKERHIPTISLLTELWNFLIPVSTNMPALTGFRVNAISLDSRL
jgi:hypothetical protein